MFFARMEQMTPAPPSYNKHPGSGSFAKEALRP
jgi:hypothetical protein